MAYFGSYSLCVHILACLVAATHGTFYPETIYLSDNCGQQYHLKEDVRIKLASTQFLPPNQTCSMLIQADIGMWVLAQFLSYHMDGSYTNEYGSCEYESLQLYNDYGRPQLPDPGGYCRVERPVAVFDLGYRGNFSYTTYRKNQIRAADVELLVSAYLDKIRLHCPSGYFDCYYNNYCVSKSVTCNGYNDCGNNRDETVGCDHGIGPRLSPGVIPAIVVVVIVIFCSAAVAILYTLKRKMRRRYRPL